MHLLDYTENYLYRMALHNHEETVSMRQFYEPKKKTCQHYSQQEFHYFCLLAKKPFLRRFNDNDNSPLLQGYREPGRVPSKQSLSVTFPQSLAFQGHTLGRHHVNLLIQISRSVVFILIPPIHDANVFSAY